MPEDVAFPERPAVALAAVDRLLALGVRFGGVCADGGNGKSGDFRRALTARGLPWAVTITQRQRAYPAAATFLPALPGRKYPRPHVGGAPVRPSPVADLIAALGPDAFQRIAWRDGTKGPLAGDFAMCRVRLVAPPPGAAAGAAWNSAGKTPQAEPEAVWLVCQRVSEAHKRTPRSADGHAYRYYAASLPETATPEQVVSTLRARWGCEEAHQQLKGELGLGHYEGRGWRGLHHHLLLTAIAYAFLQHLRLVHPTAAALPAATGQPDEPPDQSPAAMPNDPPNAAPPEGAARGGELGPTSPAADVVSLAGPPRAGPPAGPSVPAVRRAIIAALRGRPPCVVRCPACRARAAGMSTPVRRRAVAVHDARRLTRRG